MPAPSSKAAKAASTESDRTSEQKGHTAQVGNLTKDPELRFNANGQAFCQMGLAVERPVKPGEWAGERYTTFYDVVAFGDMAENAATSFAKGMRILVMGRAMLESWTDSEGKRQASKKVLADAIGPDLRWATAEVSKVGARKPADQAASEPNYDEEPF